MPGSNTLWWTRHIKNFVLLLELQGIDRRKVRAMRVLNTMVCEWLTWMWLFRSRNILSKQSDEHQTHSKFRVYQQENNKGWVGRQGQTQVQGWTGCRDRLGAGMTRCRDELNTGMDWVHRWTPFRDRLRGRDGLGAGTDLPQVKRNAMYVRVFFFFFLPERSEVA